MKMIFISGLPKSGTTYCANILRELPGVEAKMEPHLFTKPIGNQEFDSLWNCLQGIQPWFAGQVWNMSGLVIYKNDNLTQTEFTYQLDSLVGELIRQTIAHLTNPNKITLFKHPIMEIGSLKALRWCFPQAKVIWMVRNFWDWVISNIFWYARLAKKVGLDHPWFTIHDYGHIVRYQKGKEKYPLTVPCARKLLKIYHLFDQASKYNINRIAYEDLVMKPKETCEKILKYIELKCTPDELQTALKKGESSSDLMESFRRAGQVGEYKNHLDDKFIQEVLKEETLK